MKGRPIFWWKPARPLGRYRGSATNLKTPMSIGRETGAPVLVLPPSVGGVKEVTDYFKLFDYDINLLTDAIKKTGAK